MKTNTKRSFLRPSRFLAVLSFLVLCLAGVQAQNLKDDIAANNLEALKSKVALLEPDFKAFPYIAHYLKYTEVYREDMLAYLLAQGASPDQVDQWGVGPLYYAIANNSLEAVQALVSAKANVNAEWRKPKDAYWSYDFGVDREGMIELRLFDAKSRGFVSEGRGNSTMRPLAAALYSNNTDIVPALLQAGADPLGWLYRIKDAKASTASTTVYAYSNSVFDHIVGRFAASRGELDQLNELFFANAIVVWKAAMALPAARRPVLPAELRSNLFAYFANGAMKEFKAELVKTEANTLAFLPYAALAGNWDIIDLILKYNNLEIDDYFNTSEQSLLSWAISNLHAGASALLLEHGATMPALVRTGISSWDERDMEPLVWAALRGKPELVRVLLRFKADPNDGYPLFDAHAYPVVRALLLEAGADSDVVLSYTRSGMPCTLVMDAAEQDLPEAIGFWLEQGLDPNGVGSGQPLLAAVHRGNPESVRILLAKGAAPGITIDSDHLSQFDLPKEWYLMPLIDYARHLATKTTEPLARSRASRVVTLLDKSIAAERSGAEPAKYSIGSKGPAGGLVFFDKGYYSDGWRYLEAAPIDTHKGIEWYNDSLIGVKTGRGIGTGRANTAAIILAQGSGQYAAQVCADLVLGGYVDWFLPSKDELALMYKNLHQAGLGGFGGGWFWSSSQSSSGSAWVQNFSDGAQYYDYEGSEDAVRALRAF